jgi:D-aspartate ligase
LGYCVVRELRTHPLGFGSASTLQPVVDEEIAAMCDRFLRSIGYVGICEIELKRDSRDGKLRLIEVNPRCSVTTDCATYAGVHLGWLHYLDLIGERVLRNHSHTVRLSPYGALSRSSWIWTIPGCRFDDVG